MQVTKASTEARVKEGTVQTKEGVNGGDCSVGNKVAKALTDPHEPLSITSTDAEDVRDVASDGYDCGGGLAGGVQDGVECDAEAMFDDRHAVCAVPATEHDGPVVGSCCEHVREKHA
jgi:hypothetical protein